MPQRTPCLPRRTLLAAALLATPLFAAADSGAGVDTVQATKFDPTGGAAFAPRDALGTSLLSPDQRRSPTGNLYLCPAEPPTLVEAGNGWQYSGHVQIGYFSTSGDDDNALWNRYAGWDSGPVLGLFELSLRRPSDGSYAEVRASRLSDDDAFFNAAFGRAGSYKVEAFMRELPNTLTSTAQPIWNGVGTNHLSLPDLLTPSGSTEAQVAAVSAGTAPRTLKVTREKQGLGFSAYLTSQWTMWANVSHEERQGARPFGGAFYYSFLFPDSASALETVRPVDDSTINLNGGFRYAGNVWRMDFQYTGSFYRDRYTQFTFENPFRLVPAVIGATSAPIDIGQFATEPDNDYHNLRATFTRRLPLNGEFSLTASGGRMSQDDTLIPPVACTGTFGIDVVGNGQPGPNNPDLHSCAQWNTPAALSRQTADLSIDTTLMDARFTLQPAERVTLRGGVKFNREDYRGVYLAYNPLTGDYGYIAENGAPASIVPGNLGVWNPLTSPSAIVRVRSLPLDQQTTTANLGADWRLGDRNTLGATFTFNRYEPTNRERQQVDDDSVKLTWVNRAIEKLTLRANFTFLRRRGDAYDPDPYDSMYSTSLPGFVPPEGGVPSYTVDAMRMFDLADRDERKFDIMATYAPREDMTLSASLRGDLNDYDAEIGRQRYDTLGLSVQWEWQPTPATRVSAYYGADRSTLRMANVGDVVNGPDGSLGGPNYPDDARWWTNDKQRNRNAGVTFDHRIGRWRFDASWNSLDARGITAFRFNGGSALAYFSDGRTAREGVFPSMTYRTDSLTVGASYALSARWSLRVFDYYERARVSDWHYLGFDESLTYGRRVYTDGGPQGYDANLLGVLIDMKL